MADIDGIEAIAHGIIKFPGGEIDNPLVEGCLGLAALALASAAIVAAANIKAISIGSINFGANFPGNRTKKS